MTTAHEVKRLIVTIQLLRPDLRRRYVNDRVAASATLVEIGRELGVSAGRAGQIGARGKWDQIRGIRPGWHEARIVPHYRRRLEIALERIGWPERDAFWAKLESEG
jgi:hypothetical protein